jgi:outer membrane protein assembly factor BamB
LSEAGRAALAALLAPLLAATVADAAPPWPSMRHDLRNTGASPIVGRYRGERPWRAQTGRGIFSTPVIGADGTAYVGSADRSFYAVAPGGRVRWRFRTGGIIDAAAALGGGTVTFGSGDERLYRLRLGGGRPLWTFRPTLRPAPGQLVSWWEGNPAIGPDGTIYAGNTGGGAYAVRPDGRQRWAFGAGNSVWTTPAFGPDGTTYWGSLDLKVYALDAIGRPRWTAQTLGYVVSSPALGADGTVYVASFDHKLYALDPATGATRWTFATGDHVYSSAALGRDAVYIASTDGSVYALNPATGAPRWRYDTGDVVRSSPVVGRAPGGGEIVYVGSGDGRLYALDGATGRRRWSFDTTPRDPMLRDRNDLNGSPALGPRGVLIAGESGALWSVPYDYCLHRRDARCSTDPHQPLGHDLARVLPVTTGGSTRPGTPPVAPGATVLAARLVVRRAGITQRAAFAPGLRITTRPRFAFTTALSGDGAYAHVVPTGFLRPGTRYHVRVRGAYTVPGAAGGRADDAFTFRTAPAAARPPLRAGRVLRLSRLALPLPPFVTSVNQIGFDSYDLAAAVVRAKGDRLLLWVVGTRPEERGLAFPLSGRVRGADVILSGRDVGLTFSFGAVPARRFELRARLGRDLRAAPGTGVYAEVTCADVPVYGAALQAIGLCNGSGTLPVSGTLLAGPARAPRRPRGARLVAVRRTARAVTATLARRAPQPVFVLLVGGATGRPVSLDYPRATRRAGARVTVTAPRALPRRMRAYVMSGAVVLGARDIG